MAGWRSHPSMSDAVLHHLGRETSGVFTPAMAAAAGIPRVGLTRMRRAGLVSRVCGLGHVAGSGRPTIEQRAVAACLTWPDAVVCERTAAILHGLLGAEHDDGLTHVLVPNGRRPFRGLATHYWSVRPTEVERRGAIALTDGLTTLADCLGRFDDVDAWGLLAWLATRDRITADDVEAQIAERYHLYGVPRLRSMAAALRRGAVSAAEVELHEFLDRCGFTGWAGNQKIWHAGTIVANADVLFAEERLVLEFDGRLAHPRERGRTTPRQRRDDQRDRLLRALGYRVIRIRWEQLVFRPDLLRRLIEDALSAAREAVG